MYEELMSLASQNQSFCFLLAWPGKAQSGRRTGVKNHYLEPQSLNYCATELHAQGLHHRAGIGVGTGTGREMRMHAIKHWIAQG